MRKEVICLSEAGWRGIRRFSLLLNRLNIPSVVCINACPSEEVRQLIEPKPHIQHFFLPRKLFRLLSYLILFLRAFGGQVSAVVVEKQRTLKMLRALRSLWKVPIFFLEEIDGGFRIFQDGVEVKNPDAVLEGLLR